ncbi:glycosyltransferase family 90 protein [Zalerion maritima]|uniref:Glycosyltransferase family 90 protein n=1 Tax=Zalerion maritima TaxID=339359 RepID=A0AAD5S4Y0_9PEZI|nr:glycosyltransferase family 90 protein [Zalerion maritima]
MADDKEPILPFMKSPMIRTRPLRFILNRFVLPAVVLTVIFLYLGQISYFVAPAASDRHEPPGSSEKTSPVLEPHQPQVISQQPLGLDNNPPFSYSKHPIEQLVEAADQQFDALLSKEAKNLADAANTYKLRRGRHPPPGFAAWYQYAVEHSSMVIEDLFDPIYDDLAPFWGLDPIRMRQDASCFEMRLTVRNGNVSTASDWFWTRIWKDMIKEIEHLLPDMDVALNAMDEPRIVAPYEEVERARQVGMANRVDFSNPKTKAEDMVNFFPRLPKNLVDDEDKKKVTSRMGWIREGSYWDITKAGCSPESNVGKKTQQTPTYMYRGFVSNFSQATSVCENPALYNTSGIFTHPLSIKTTQTLFPLFGGSKLETNNEIRLPAPMYYDENENFSGGGEHGPEWENKTNHAVWRGFASGGLAGSDRWKGMQRHRFVQLNNATAIPGPSRLAAVKDNHFDEWAERVSNVHFTGLNCGDKCASVHDHFQKADKMTLAEQFESKLLPDIDGNSFSGRYRGFLASTSLPVKATIWKEWHDSRLVPWKHFVPMSYWFEEWWDIVEYFLGYMTSSGVQVGGNDKMGKKIATDGKEWAEKVLRKEDMVVYTFRLLLEYARVTDAEREKMGWAEDVDGR